MWGIFERRSHLLPLSSLRFPHVLVWNVFPKSSSETKKVVHNCNGKLYKFLVIDKGQHNEWWQLLYLRHHLLGVLSIVSRSLLGGSSKFAFDFSCHQFSKFSDRLSALKKPSPFVSAKMRKRKTIRNNCSLLKVKCRQFAVKKQAK